MLRERCSYYLKPCPLSELHPPQTGAFQIAGRHNKHKMSKTWHAMLAPFYAMRKHGMRKTELAKRLGISETVVRRMLDPKHGTKPERIQAALAALGKRIVVTFDDAA